MKKFLSLCVLILILSVTYQFVNAPAPQILWSKCIGGTGEENILYMIKLNDGNYLSCGTTNSQNGSFNAIHGGYDGFLMKTGNGGNIIWKQVYGGSYDEAFYNIMETKNGDIVAIGTTGSNDQQVTQHHGARGTDDIWLVKINSNGQLIKEHCYGGSGSESTLELGMSEGLLMDNIGNILFVGETDSNDGDVSGNHGNYDGWIAKVDPNTFNIINSKTIGDAAYDAAYNIYEIKGDLFVTGCKSTVAYTTTNAQSVEDHGKGFATSLDAVTFNTKWYKTYGGSGSEYCNASVVTQDENLVLTGHAASSDGDCVGNHGFNTWTWKIKSDSGTILWKNFTGVPGDTSAAFNMTATSDGDFLLVGGITHTLNPYLPDGYVIKINKDGNTEWTKKFGGSNDDQLLAVVEKNDKKILVGGLTYSTNGVVGGYQGGPVTSQKFHRFPARKKNGPASDAWMVELK